MKKLNLVLFVSVLTLLLVAGYVYFNFKGRIDLLGGGTPIVFTLVGSASDAKHLPAVAFNNVYVVADATNTDPTYDGGTVTQRVLTTGADIVRLNFKAVGSVSTSTVDVKLLGSVDGTNYFDMMYSTSTPNLAGNGTTTPSLAPYVTSFVPGVATTSWTYDYTVTGTNYVRFLFKSNDVAHLNKGAQAFIQAVPNYEF